MLTLSATEARHLALKSAGLYGSGVSENSRVLSEPVLNPLSKTLHTLQLVQIDSVNYFERSHYMPAFSRLGAYDKRDFKAEAFGSDTAPARFIEYMAHEATFIAPSDFRLFQWRMDHFRRKFGSESSWAANNTALFAEILEELADRGPLLADDFSHDDGQRHPRWSTHQSSVKRALELMFLWGDVVTYGRQGFSRRYALPEQALSNAILNTPPVSTHDAQVELVAKAIRVLGVGTIKDIADFYRMTLSETRQALTTLIDQGRVTHVRVPEWGDRDREAFLDPANLEQFQGMGRLQSFTAGSDSGYHHTEPSHAAFLSPFDPLVWFRPRAERLFDFHYRIEIYTPSHKRKYGYYCLPILVEDRLVGRFDLKNHRKTGVLEVRAAWSEPNMFPDDLSHILELLDEARAWQGLDRVEIHDVGNVADRLNRAAASMNHLPIGKATQEVSK